MTERTSDSARTGEQAQRQYRNGIEVDPPEGYNGWTNAETWHTKLCMDNDGGTYHRSRAYARAIVDETAEAVEVDGLEAPFSTVEQQAAYYLAEWLHDWHDERAYEGGRGMPDFAQQYVRYGLDSTNWMEIAENLIAEVKEEAAYAEG